MTLFIGYCIFTWIVGLFFMMDDFTEKFSFWAWVLEIGGLVIFPILFPCIIGQFLKDQV